MAAAANPDLVASRQNADNLYAALPVNLRSTMATAIIRSQNSPFRDGPDDSVEGRAFASVLQEHVVGVPPSRIVAALGLSNEVQKELLDLMSAKMNQLNPPAAAAAAPAAGGRRRGRKSTTRVRVRGRPSTRRTRRATYGARRRATSARSVRARRPSK